MQNENFIETRPQTSNYTLIYVQERQEGAKRLVFKDATTCREAAETLLPFLVQIKESWPGSSLLLCLSIRRGLKKNK